MNKLTYKEIIRGLPPVLTSSDTVSIDLELSGLREEQLHRPAGRLTSIACSFDGETAYICFEEDEVQEFLERIDRAVWIFHNSTFDLGHLRRWAKVNERENMRDTMLIEKIMFSDYYDDFGLNDLVRRYLHCYMDKDVRKEFHALEGGMTPEQITYAGLDVIATWLVDREQQKIIQPKEKTVWEKIDLPTVWISIGLSGFSIDRDKWFDIADKNQIIVDEIEQELGQKYGHPSEKIKFKKRMPKLPEKFGYNENGEYVEIPLTEVEQEIYDTKYQAYLGSKVVASEFIPFNPASPSQVLSILNAQGIPVTSTGDDELRPYIANPFVARILAHRTASKKVSTYGKPYMKFVEDDGRIYSSLNVIGAATGRLSSRSPNLQQIPRDAEYRSCFIAGQGKKLIIADYSAQEPRIFASICKDENLMAIFNSGKDIYCEVARVAFDEEITKKDKERRNQIKALVLGLIYGLSPFGFARDNEVDQEVAEDMFNRFFLAFPKAEQWVKEQQRLNRGFTRTVLGRKCHLHPYNVQWKRNALNNTMQGTGADMTKLAMKRFSKTFSNEIENGECGIVLTVHDEIIIWCIESRADFYQKALEVCMVEIAELIHVGVPGVVEASIADSWAEK